MISLPFIKRSTPSLYLFTIFIYLSVPSRPSPSTARVAFAVCGHPRDAARVRPDDNINAVGHRAKPVGRSFRNGRAHALRSPPPRPANVIDNGDRFMIGHCLAARNHPPRARACVPAYACDCVVTTHAHSIIIVVVCCVFCFYYNL